MKNKKKLGGRVGTFARRMLKVVAEKGCVIKQDGGPFSSSCEKEFHVDDFKMYAWWSSHMSGITESSIEIKKNEECLFRAFIRWNWDTVESIRIAVDRFGQRKIIEDALKKQLNNQERIIRILNRGIRHAWNHRLDKRDAKNFRKLLLRS